MPCLHVISLVEWPKHVFFSASDCGATCMRKSQIATVLCWDLSHWMCKVDQHADGIPADSADQQSRRVLSEVASTCAE